MEQVLATDSVKLFQNMHGVEQIRMTQIASGSRVAKL